MKNFIDWLSELSRNDTKVRAILRRSLSFDPGTFIPAYPYVEPFIKNEGDSWRRKVHYLSAGLWAAHWREGRMAAPLPIGGACAAYHAATGSSSVESRFMTLLNSDFEELPHRLRQMIGLLKDYNIDFVAMLKGLLLWKDDQKRTQNAWARDFYRNGSYQLEGEPNTEEETNDNHG